jgi:hypothetical protein
MTHGGRGNEERSGDFDREGTLAEERGSHGFDQQSFEKMAAREEKLDDHVDKQYYPAMGMHPKGEKSKKHHNRKGY